MEAQKHRVYNSTRGSVLSPGVNSLNAMLEHLTVLRVLIEGLADNLAAGLWLTEARGIPSVPRISPLDLIYLDEAQRVVTAAELLPSAPFPTFSAPAMSVLVLPFQTISASKTAVGDSLTIEPVAEVAVDSDEDAIRPQAAAAPPQQVIREAEQIDTVPKSKTGSHPLPQVQHPTESLSAAQQPPQPQSVRPTQPQAAPQSMAQHVALPETETLPHYPRRNRPTVLVEQKDSWVVRLLHWLNPNVYHEERRKSIRRPTQELVAYGGPRGAPVKHDVEDISSTGLYLRTAVRWPPGETVNLTLQRRGQEDMRQDRSITVEADAVRWGKDGVGLAFNFPESMHLDLWECAARGATFETGPDYIVREIRIARAMGVIRSICPAAAEEANRLLHRGFSNVRVAGAVQVALLAEGFLARVPDAEALRAPYDLVLYILDSGSWADVDWIQAMWAGLLATACTRDGVDISNAELAEVLGQLTPIHLKILTLVCESAPAEAGGAPGCTASELARLLSVSNMTKMLRSIAELDVLGLLTTAKRSPSMRDEETRTAATPLGLKFLARCQGRRENTATSQPAPRYSEAAH